MKKNFVALLLVITFSVFIFSGCNESGSIWAKYAYESFCATVRYELCGEIVCVRVSVSRSEQDTVKVEFSSPDALRDATGSFDGEEFRLCCNNINISGEAAKKLLIIPTLLAARDALSFEKAEDGERRLLVAEIEGGKIFFDVEAEKPIHAELYETDCEIITFEWRS